MTRSMFFSVMVRVFSPGSMVHAQLPGSLRNSMGFRHLMMFAEC
jgi:hypothetical protein